MSMPSFQQAAEYVDRGWLPIPLVPKEKRPAVKFAALAAQDFVLYDERRLAYWTGTPNAGVGILLRPSGLLVVDCDSEAAVEEAIEASAGEPCNNIVVSAHGAHFYYLRPEGCPPLRTVHRGASGKIDILADGYMVAPPSVHPSGHQYRWYREGPLQEAPEWAVGLLSAIRARSIAHTQIDPQAVAGAFPSTAAEADMLREAIRCRDARVVAYLSDTNLRANGAQVDRSAVLWLTLNTLIRLGSDVGPSNKARDRLKKTIGDLPDESIAKVVWFGTLGSDLVGEKPRQRGWQWFCDEIARARLEIVAR